MGGAVNLEKEVSLSHANPDTNRIGVNLKITTKTNFNRQVKYKERQVLKSFSTAYLHLSTLILIRVHPSPSAVKTGSKFCELLCVPWLKTVLHLCLSLFYSPRLLPS